MLVVCILVQTYHSLPLATASMCSVCHIKVIRISSVTKQMFLVTCSAHQTPIGFVVLL